MFQRSSLAFDVRPVVLVLGLVWAGGAHASDHVLYDQGDASDLGGISLSGYVIASDFQTDRYSRLDTVTLWAAGEAPPEDFRGISYLEEGFGWAIYSDDGGPNLLLFSGYDATPTLVDTGVDTTLGRAFQVQLDLDGQPAVFSGTYWLALHEGPWGSPATSTHVYIFRSASDVGLDSLRATPTAEPSGWLSNGSDYAFVVEGDPVAAYLGRYTTANGRNVSEFVVADDFQLTGATTLGSLDVWLSDDSVGNDNGLLDTFADTLSWAIYSNESGAPGTLLHSGEDSSPIFLDSGVQDASNTDIVRVRIQLAGRPTLGIGTYWLAVHEGAWLSPDDGTTVWIQHTPFTNGAAAVYASDETAPAGWTTMAGAQLAFVLFEDELFASGFEAGVTCAWSSAIGGETCP